MDVGIDYAGSSPGAAAVKEAGYKFVARYLSRYTAKTIQKPEYDDMTSNGVGVVLVFEDYANQALSGFDQGAADAQVALAQANALGWPQSRPIHFAVDFDISDAQKLVAGQYMQGVISVLGLPRTGAYGGYWWIKYCAENNLATFFWQAVAWSGGNVHPQATLFQQLGGTVVNGTSCDIDKALKTDYGQWGQEGQDMAISEDALYMLIKGLTHREPTQEEAATAEYLTNPDLAIRTFWNNGGAANYAAESQLQTEFDQANAAANTRYGYEKQIADLLGVSNPDDVNSIVAAIKALQTTTPSPGPVPTPTPAPNQPPTRLPAWIQSVINFLQGK